MNHIPKHFISIGHIIMGSFIAYVACYKKFNKLNTKILCGLGVAAVAYHGYCLYKQKFEGFTASLSGNDKVDVDEKTKYHIGKAE